MDACGLHHVTFNMGAFAGPTPLLGFGSDVDENLDASDISFVKCSSLVSMHVFNKLINVRVHLWGGARKNQRR